MVLSANSETSLAIKTMTHQSDEHARLIKMGDITPESQETFSAMVEPPVVSSRQTMCLNSGDQGSCPTFTSVSAAASASAFSCVSGLRPQTLNLPQPRSPECRHRDQSNHYDHQQYQQQPPQHHYHRQQQRQQHQYQISMDQTTTYIFWYVFFLLIFY